MVLLKQNLTWPLLVLYYDGIHLTAKGVSSNKDIFLCYSDQFDTCLWYSKCTTKRNICNEYPCTMSFYFTEVAIAMMFYQRIKCLRYLYIIYHLTRITYTWIMFSLNTEYEHNFTLYIVPADYIKQLIYSTSRLHKTADI